MGVEFLEFDLGFEAVLGFHDYVHKFVPVSVPLFDATQIPGTAFIVDDESKELMMLTIFTFGFVERRQHRLTNPIKGVKWLVNSK